MTNPRLAALLALLMVWVSGQTHAAAQEAPGPVDTVHVAPPTGEREADRASILVALGQVPPGGTVHFAAGTYLIGEIIRVPIPRVTLLGHTEGTVIRGCDPDSFPEFPVALLACHGFELSGANQTVRNLTFEYTWHGLFIGCCFPADEAALEANEQPERNQPGGHLVEGNTFRYAPNGIRVIGESPEPTVVRNNTFLDVYHAIGVNGRTVHFLDNHIFVRDPGRVPISTHPGGAINLTPFGRGTDHTSCANNVIAGNRIEGHPEAIGIWIDFPATSCRNNTVRDNTIRVQRVSFTAPWMGIRFSDEADSTLVGMPLFLYNVAAAKGLTSEPGQEAFLEDNVIEGNRIIGAEGLGIHLVHASRNRIVNNTISAIRPRDPFPGNDLHLGNPPEWSGANGSGILVSAGSDGNEIRDNTFEDIALHAIVLEGDRNRVETKNGGDAVRDAGSGNRVSGPADDPETAGFEDYRVPVGRMEGGVLRIALDARPVAWQPWGPDGAAILAHAFAADGAPPRVPGPLIRVTAGTPVHVTVRNSFDHPLVVRGLQNRVPPQPGAPPALDSLVVAAGATAEVRFTPLVPVTSIFAGVVQTPPGTPSGPLIGGADEANRPFVGLVIVDPPDAPGHEERFFIINHWGDGTIPSSFLPATRFFVNGRSWPHTERLEYAQGDTVRWRVINFTGRPHPMHLHGFYFRVDARGDLLRERVYTPEERRLAVTEVLQPTQTMRITWVPEEPGNWIFHCHFMRHMSSLQNAPLEGAAASHHHGAGAGGQGEDLMGGLVLGITVRPGPEYTPSADVPRRRLPLHIGMRPGVFDDAAGYGFVLQEGPEPPAADSVRFPGSPLVLTRGEPTEIVVHNRADVPLGVHWHGLELESWADGVPGWSGMPGRTVPAIPPGDSLAVRMTPPRAGTFMYHVHSEPGHQLAQGLYGTFLVLEPGERWDRDVDHAFLLGSLGAGEDAPAAVNGELDHGPVELRAGSTHRLRFMHMSPDDDKRVFLLADGEPVEWRHVAKDGADLPAAQVRVLPADLAIHVGETYDFLWTPAGPGDYTLRIVTTFDRGAPAFPRDAPPPHTQEIPVRVRPARSADGMNGVEAGAQEVVQVAAPTGERDAEREGEVETDDGVRLYYRVEGEGRDTVVVVHGGPSLGHAYLAPDLVPLARGRAVVHYDQRGIGRSTPLRDPERLTVERHVQDLDALRAHFGLERLTLLGHSWGGMLAARYAAAHPERVERILLLDPMAPARDPFMAMGNARAQEMVRARLDEPARARLDSLAATAEVADPGELCRERYSLLTPIFFEDPGRRARSRADFCAGTPETMRNRPEVAAAIFGSLGEWDVRPALGHVRSPVLVVRGAEGAIPREAMEAWVEAFPNARLLTIEGAGHYPHVDRPEVFFPAAEVFFGGGWPETEAKAYQLDEVVP